MIERYKEMEPLLHAMMLLETLSMSRGEGTDSEWTEGEREGEREE
jgi:hypothetical protein